MSKPLLSLCQIPKLSMRDGWAGANAHIYLPFYQYGYWFASGQQYTFNNSTIPQWKGRTLGGTDMTTTYIKEAGACLNP